MWNSSGSLASLSRLENKEFPSCTMDRRHLPGLVFCCQQVHHTALFYFFAVHYFLIFPFFLQDTLTRSIPPNILTLLGTLPYWEEDSTFVLKILQKTKAPPSFLIELIFPILRHFFLSFFNGPFQLSLKWKLRLNQWKILWKFNDANNFSSLSFFFFLFFLSNWMHTQGAR